MLVPYGVDNPMGRLPIANWALIAANLVAYVVQVNSGVVVESVEWRSVAVYRFVLEYGLVPADFHWYQLVTCAFLHGGILHLLGNMVFLWTFGNNVNDRLGHARYLAFYLLFTVLASLGHVAANSGSPIPAVGASGAISGVMGIYLAFYPVNDVRMFYFIFVKMGTFSWSSYWMIGLWVGFDAYEALSGTAGSVAVWAHLAGFAVGFGSGLLLLWTEWTERDEYDFLSWLARRHDKRLMERYSLGGAVRPGGGPLPSPPGATSTPVAPHRPVSPGDARKAIDAHLENSEVQALQEAYQDFVNVYPRLALDKDSQIRVANALFRAGSHALAAEAYARFARFYPDHPQAPDALFSAGILHVEKLNHPDVGRRLLEQALPLLSDPAKIERARRALAATEGSEDTRRIHMEE